MTYLHQRLDGRKVEYRLAATSRPGILDIEYRLVRCDGTAYTEEWYALSDAAMMYLPAEIISKLQADQT